MAGPRGSCWGWGEGGDLEKREKVCLKMCCGPGGGSVCVKGTESTEMCGSVG